MRFSQIHHCSVVVYDLERAAAFYRDVLGLPEIAIPTTFRPAGLDVRWFQIGTQQIHLLLSSKPQPASPGHMALQVEDAGAARRRLQAQGLDVQEVVPIPDAERFFIADPDGNRIEIIEWKKAYPTVPILGREDAK